MRAVIEMRAEDYDASEKGQMCYGCLRKTPQKSQFLKEEEEQKKKWIGVISQIKAKRLQ